MEKMTHSSTFLLPKISADHGPELTYILIVLNRPLPRFTPLLWKHAQLRLCADGGANRLYDELPLLFPHEDAEDIRKRYKPDVIKGDMDSIRQEVSRFYKDVGTEAVDASDDQDTTDLHKCVVYIEDLPSLKNQEFCILAAGALDGRFDHKAANINVMCHFPNRRIILLSEDCLVQLLPNNQLHEIHIQSTVVGPHCGLIPIGGSSKTNTTTGLQWNLSNTEMRFGGLISTSNIVKDEIVTVESDIDLLWTISMEKIMTHSSTFQLPKISADHGPEVTYVLIVLNRPLPRFTPLLWKHAQLRICADGGANRLYDDLPLLFPEEDAEEIRKRYKPDLIKGDMDSIRQEVLRFYKDVGTEAVDASDDQDTTDLHKCVAYIQDLPRLKNQDFCILAVGALDGRFDHEAGNINVMYQFPNRRIILLSDDCLIQLLPHNKLHEIHIQSAIFGPHCGLIPFGGFSKTNTTTGLQWNLSDTEMRFGGLISTSNIVKDEVVTVKSDVDLLWTISINIDGMMSQGSC